MTAQHVCRLAGVAPRTLDRDGQADKSALVHTFVERHLKGGADNYAIALLLEKAGYTFRDLSDALIASRGM